MSSCLLAGYFPFLSMHCFRTSLCVWIVVHWFSSWSFVWSPCPQMHVASSRSLKRLRYALVFPCPVSITKTVIWMFWKGLSFSYLENASNISKGEGNLKLRNFCCNVRSYVSTAPEISVHFLPELYSVMFLHSLSVWRILTAVQRSSLWCHFWVSFP
jgi:hypothetical protein